MASPVCVVQSGTKKCQLGPTSQAAEGSEVFLGRNTGDLEAPRLALPGLGWGFPCGRRCPFLQGAEWTQGAVEAFGAVKGNVEWLCKGGGSQIGLGTSA